MPSSRSRPPVVRNFDRAAKFYDATRSLPPKVMDTVIARLMRRLGRRGLVLDLGVGTGRFAAPLTEAGLDLAGLDVSREMMSVARSKGVPNLVQSLAQSTPFRSGVFETTIMVHFIHLVEDWQKVLAEVGRVTRGKVVALVNESTGPSPHRRYGELLKGRGFRTGGPRTGEKELSKRIRPSDRRFFASYTDLIDLKDEVSHFAARKSAITWDVPQKVHRAIIRQLRREFVGRVKATKELYYYEWSAESLRRRYPSLSP